MRKLFLLAGVALIANPLMYVIFVDVEAWSLFLTASGGGAFLGLAAAWGREDA